MNTPTGEVPFSGTTPPSWDPQSQPHQRRAPHSQQPYQFNSDEMRVLRECNRESFYQRSLPLATIFGFGTYYAVKSGYLKSSARYGPTPKVFLSLFAGYFLGKLSYQKICAEKMMQLPNSPLGEMLRKKRQHAGGSTFSDSLGLEPGFVAPSLGLGGNSSTPVDSFDDTYSDRAPSSMELDITQPLQDITDARTEFSSRDTFLEEEPLPPAQSTTTYEELRRQNREEYEKRRSRGLPGFEDPNIIRAPRPPPSTPQQASPGQQNQYGDTWVR